MANKQDQNAATVAPPDAPRQGDSNSALEYLRQNPLPRVLVAIVAGSSLSLLGLLVYLSRPSSQDEAEVANGSAFTMADALAVL